MNWTIRLFRQIAIEIPSGIGNTIWKYSVALAWAGLVYTIISTLYELTLFNHAISALYASVGDAAQYLRLVGEYMFHVFQVWDQITDPLVAWLRQFDFEWLRYIERFAVVITLLIPSTVRFTWHVIMEAIRRHEFEAIDLEVRRAQLAAATEDEDASASGGGAAVGAVLGGLVGAVLGPAGMVAGAAIGAAAGASLGGQSSAGTENERVKQLLPALETAEDRLALSRNRFRVALTLLRASFVVTLCLGALIVVDIFSYNDDLICGTQRTELGTACQCQNGGERLGLVVRESGDLPIIVDHLERNGVSDPERFQNLCVISTRWWPLDA